MIYLKFTEMADAEQLLQAENLKQGYPGEGNLTLNAFSILEVDGEILVKKPHVTVEIDYTKCVEVIKEPITP
jgi:hypothetical protein